ASSTSAASRPPSNAAPSSIPAASAIRSRARSSRASAAPSSKRYASSAGSALFEAIRFADGRLLNPHFAQYRLPRFPDVPPIELVLLDRKDLPSAGAGECPIVALAPAVAGAMFEATGKRVRALPLEGLGS